MVDLESDAHAGGGVSPEEAALPALPVVLHADGAAQLLRQGRQERRLNKLLLQAETKQNISQSRNRLTTVQFHSKPICFVLRFQLISKESLIFLVFA